MRFLTPSSFLSSRLFALVIANLLINTTHGQVEGTATDTTDRSPIQPAIDGVLSAFDEFPLVGLSDKHGLSQEMEFYEALIRDPRFAQNVGNVVVEFGGAARQSVIDRYTNGDAVPYLELRQVWTDTVGWLPTVQYLGYAYFFAQVRDVNATLPPDDRIRVWLGEPPIVWDDVHTSEDYSRFGDRDGHAANVISENILSRGEKALVIYGGQHFSRITPEEDALRAEWAEVDPENAQPADPRLPGLVEAEYPDAFYIVQVYEGFEDPTCTANFEQRMSDWMMPVLATPIRGTQLESAMRLCSTQIRRMFPPTMPVGLQRLLLIQANDVLYQGDAILFLGEATSFTMSPIFPDLYLDEDYRQEISRHLEIIFGDPLPTEFGRDARVTPQPYE